MTMMTCGHSANAKRKVGDDWVPACAICNTAQQADTPDLTGRKAICCGEDSIRDSNPDTLAFFEYRGPGSRTATSTCKCGYAEVGHGKPHVDKHCEKKNGVAGFVARGPWEFDKYYCGCRGWD